MGQFDCLTTFCTTNLNGQSWLRYTAPVQIISTKQAYCFAPLALMALISTWAVLPKLWLIMVRVLH